MGMDARVEDVKRECWKMIKNACGDKGWTAGPLAVQMEDLQLERLTSPENFEEKEWITALKDDLVMVTGPIFTFHTDEDEDLSFTFRVTMSDRSHGRKGVDKKVEEAMAKERLVQATQKVNEDKVQAARDMQGQLSTLKAQLGDMRRQNAEFIANSNAEKGCFVAFKNLLIEMEKLIPTVTCSSRQ
jgi:hypothetical protein